MLVKDLSERIEKGKELKILDVREPVEWQICNIENSWHIPMNEIPSRMYEIPKDNEIVVLCHHGIRSAMVVNFLKQNGFEQVHNLVGGIHAWALEIDPSMATY